MEHTGTQAIAAHLVVLVGAVGKELGPSDLCSPAQQWIQRRAVIELRCSKASGVAQRSK